jgi:hypothetical protein
MAVSVAGLFHYHEALAGPSGALLVRKGGVPSLIRDDGTEPRPLPDQGQSYRPLEARAHRPATLGQRTRGPRPRYCWHPRTRAQSQDQILYVNLGLRSVVGRFVAHRRRLHVGRISRIQLDGSVG